MRTLASEKAFGTKQSDDKIAEKLLKTIRMLERELERPVYQVDIYRATLERPIDGDQKLADRIDLSDMFKDDLILADQEMNRYSLDASL